MYKAAEQKTVGKKIVAAVGHYHVVRSIVDVQAIGLQKAFNDKATSPERDPASAQVLNAQLFAN
jgi:hypothetical protein